MAKKLTEKHPLTKKYRELEKFMLDNNLSIDWNGYEMTIIDNTTSKSAIIHKMDCSQSVQNIPSIVETVLIRDE